MEEGSWEWKAPALVSSAPKETWLMEPDSFENNSEWCHQQRLLYVIEVR